MTYVSQLPSTNSLRPLISFFPYGSLSCVLTGQNAIFMISVLSERFEKLNFCFYYALTSADSSLHCLMKTYRHSFRFFKIETLKDLSQESPFNAMQNQRRCNC